MKHAVLVTAYKDFDSLLSLANAFERSFHSHVHLDRNIRINRVQPGVPLALRGLRRVTLIKSSYRVSWDGDHHRNVLPSLAHATSHASNGIQFFHWLTGQDYPVRSAIEFAYSFKASESILF